MEYVFTIQATSEEVAELVILMKEINSSNIQFYENQIVVSSQNGSYEISFNDNGFTLTFFGEMSQIDNFDLFYFDVPNHLKYIKMFDIEFQVLQVLVIEFDEVTKQRFVFNINQKF